MDLSNLKSFGLTANFYQEYENSLKKFSPDLQDQYQLARVISVHRGLCKIVEAQGEKSAYFSGKGQTENSKFDKFPVVGDWVIVEHNNNHSTGTIRKILPRISKFSRNIFDRKRLKCKADEQVIAANIEKTFVVNALNHDFNISRIERYLTIVWDSGSMPYLILNKADLCVDIEEKLEQVNEISFGLEVIVTSATEDRGIVQLENCIKPGETCIFLGSSGVGKSSLINLLLQQSRIKVEETSAYRDRGKHTTTTRSMYLLPNGGLVIDTPGLRGIQLWTGNSDLGEIFADIEELKSRCRFSNCTHQSEPGCAILQAMERGDLSFKRLQNYFKMQRELDYIRRRAAKKADRKPRISYSQKMKKKTKHKHYLRSYYHES
ncbi:MAG: ribosome small subunit-dependent GTPase A [bacterium]